MVSKTLSILIQHPSCSVPHQHLHATDLFTPDQTGSCTCLSMNDQSVRSRYGSVSGAVRISMEVHFSQRGATNKKAVVRTQNHHRVEPERSRRSCLLSARVSSEGEFIFSSRVRILLPHHCQSLIISVYKCVYRTLPFRLKPNVFHPDGGKSSRLNVEL